MIKLMLVNNVGRKTLPIVSKETTIQEIADAHPEMISSTNIAINGTFVAVEQWFKPISEFVDGDTGIISVVKPADNN